MKQRGMHLAGKKARAIARAAETMSRPRWGWTRELLIWGAIQALRGTVELPMGSCTAERGAFDTIAALAALAGVEVRPLRWRGGYYAYPRATHATRRIAEALVHLG